MAKGSPSAAKKPTSKSSTTATGKTAASRSTSSTTGKSVARRPTSSASPQILQRYERKKATFEGRRETKPVLYFFGRNRSLTAAERTRIQRRAYFSFAGVMVAAVVLVLIYGLVNFNILQPAATMVTVNGVNIPQYDYRYMVAYLAQDIENKLNASNTQQTILQGEVNKTPAPKNLSDLQIQLQQVGVTISTLQTSFTQTSVDQQSINNLIEDQLIQQGAKDFEKTDPKAKAALTVTNADINQAFNNFTHAFSNGETYANFKNKDHLSDDNVKYAILIVLRRNKMDKYLQSTYVSPTKQAHILRIQVDSQAKAQSDLNNINSGKAKWADIAKKDSLDTTSSSNGGDLGWVIQGQQDQAIERWAFDPKTKVNGPPTIIKDVSGTFNIVQLIGIDPARTVSSDVLSSLKSNALSHWLTGMRDLPPTNHISAYNQDMYNSNYNVPATPPFGTGATTTPTTSSSQPVIPGSTSP
jgi:hypothetical protein